ncbi:MAG: hypothetical protein ACT4QA_08905 [Panacagrimonas sp.]
MKTYPINTESEHCYAFEIENAYITPRKIARLLKGFGGVSAIHTRKPFSSSNSIHVSFHYMGREFIVWEPFGDNSRYWIGPKHEKGNSTDVNAIREVFDRYEPPIAIKILGDLITLNVKALFRRSKADDKVDRV